MKFLRKISLVVAIFLVSLVPVNSTFAALTEAQLNFYAQNNILFYDPGFVGCLIYGGGGGSGGAKKTEILSSVELDAIMHFKPTYEKYAKETGNGAIPWQVLAVLHYMTNKTTLNNPSDGSGVYGLYNLAKSDNGFHAFLPAGKIDENEFEKQTRTASIWVGNYKTFGSLDLNTDNGLSDLFKAVNSNVSKNYIQQALELMKIIGEANNDESISSSVDVCFFDGEQLTDAQAQALADYYNSSAVDAGFWGLPYGKMNCVSFSAWFVQALTSIGRDPHAWGNGGEVAMNLNIKYGIPIGTEPAPFAVFSTKGNSGFGHTGVIVAVNGDDVTIVDASYPTATMAGSMARVRHVSRSYFNGGFIAYLGGMMDGDKLGTIVGS